MRIALFHNLPSGGAKRSLFEWTKNLSDRHHIDVYTLSTADHGFCDIRPLVNNQVTINFVPQHLFSSPWGRVNQIQRWRDLGELTKVGRQIAHMIDSKSYDVVFANPCIFTHIPAFLQFIRTPAVYYLHEPFGRKFVRSYRRPNPANSRGRETLDRFDPLIRLYNHRLATLQAKSIQKTKRLLANSYFTQEQIRLGFGVDASICHYGVDYDAFRPLLDISKENVVISVGELTPRKGFDFIVESLGQIPDPYRPKLVLACNVVDGSERKYIEELASQNSVTLQILASLDANELAVEYNKARVCVYAPVLEPFGLVPLEAMSCGIPVVGVREGGVQESILHEQTGLLVERDPGKFAAPIQRLLSNPDLALEYGRNGREHVLNNWTWDQSVASLESHLLDISN